MGDDGKIAAMADALPKGLHDVFVAVWQLPRTEPVTLDRVSRRAGVSKSVVCVHMKRLEQMGVVVRDVYGFPHSFRVSDSGDLADILACMPRAGATTERALARKGIVVGADGLTAGQRDLLAYIRALLPPEGGSLAALARATGISLDCCASYAEGLRNKGFIRFWSEKARAGLRPVRMVCVLEVPEVPPPHVVIEGGVSALKSDGVIARLYGDARYEDVPASQRLADRINTPVPSRTARFSPTQWSGA